jgi:hypothetical protein
MVKTSLVRDILNNHKSRPGYKAGFSDNIITKSLSATLIQKSLVCALRNRKLALRTETKKMNGYKVATIRVNKPPQLTRETVTFWVMPRRINRGETVIKVHGKTITFVPFVIN